MSDDRIKPLSWRKPQSHEAAISLTKWVAETILGRIEIHCGLRHLKETSEMFISGSVVFIGLGSGGPFGSANEAKIAAEKWYRKRISEALIETPSTDESEGHDE